MQQMDTFSGKTTDAVGEIDCELTYTPKDINHIIVPTVKSAAGKMVDAEVAALNGKTVTLNIYVCKYHRAASLAIATGACDGSGALPSHGSHTIIPSYDDCGIDMLANGALGIVRVQYTVA